MSECKNCPAENFPGNETYSFLGIEFDVRKARAYVEGRASNGEMMPDQIRKYGLPVDEQKERVAADGTRYFTLNIFYVNEEHLAHIPADKFEEPIIFATITTKDDRTNPLIDGTHRAVVLARRNKNVKYVVLTPSETLACITNLSASDRKRMKLFPGVKPAGDPKLKKHLPIPEQFRKEYKRAAYHVYSDVAADVPDIENERCYSEAAVVEIVRDANRIQMIATRDGRGYSDAFKIWIKKHEYDLRYKRDMDRAVREAIYS